MAMQDGTVILSGTLYLSIRSTAGQVISYLHTEKASRLVKVGEKVFAGQIIAAVGKVPPATGCHLDVRIKPDTTIDPRVASLIPDPHAGGYVNPEDFTKLFGVELCAPKICVRLV